MEIIKIIGVGFISLIITMVLKEYRKEYAVFPILIGGSIILFLSLDMMKGILEFIDKLAKNTYYENFISLLLKITGISVLTEYAISICRDSGESAIANKIDFGGKLIVISLSIPIISTALESLTSLLP